MSTVGLGIKEAVELANKSASNEPSGTFIELESGAKATQFRFSSEKLNNEPSGGLINNISSSTEVKAYLSNTGHIEVKLVGPNSEVGGEGERSLWKNGQFQDGYKNYISVGDEDQFEIVLILYTLNTTFKYYPKRFLVIPSDHIY